MPETPSSTAAALQPLLHTLKDRLSQTGVFGEIAVRDHQLICPAKAAAAPASYRLELDDRGMLWVSLVMADRWLSQSIEQDLVHTGDKIPDLLEEELADLADSFPGAIQPAPASPTFEHFRSGELLFTFRSPLPQMPLDAPTAAQTAALWLLAYEATFRGLGDMEASDED